MNPTLYDILGVPADASREEIRKAWREAADRFEPGEGGSTKQFRLFNEAAEVLLDPERRREYDAQLAGQGATKGAPAAEPAKAPQAPESPKTAEESAEPNAGDEPKAEKPAVSMTKASSEKADGSGETGEGAPASAAAVPGPPVPGTARATTTATPAAAGAAPADSAEAAGTPSRGRSLAWPVLAVLGVLTAAAVGFAAYFVTQAERAEAYQDAVDRAPAAAESAATAVLSYDYKSLEADRDAAAKYLSDDYRSKYVDTFDKLVSENATKTKATVEAQVLASSAMVVGEDRDPHRVPVLLFVNQTTTNSATTGQPSVALNRVRFDMVEVDGTWLVDDITSY